MRPSPGGGTRRSASTRGTTRAAPAPDPTSSRSGWRRATGCTLLGGGWCWRQTMRARAGVGAEGWCWRQTIHTRARARKSRHWNAIAKVGTTVEPTVIINIIIRRDAGSVRIATSSLTCVGVVSPACVWCGRRGRVRPTWTWCPTLSQSSCTSGSTSTPLVSGRRHPYLPTPPPAS